MDDREQIQQKRGRTIFTVQQRAEGRGYRDMNTKKPKPLTVLLYNFIRGTTAHGLPKVVTSESWTRKLIWLAVFFIAFGYFSYQCTILVEEYFKYPVAVRINIDTSQRLQFPAVTICNMNMLKKGLAKANSKYKQLVGIDKFTERQMMSLLKNSSASRKRRAVSDNAKKNIEIGPQRLRRPVATEKNAAPYSGSRASSGKRNHAGYRSRLGRAIVKGIGDETSGSAVSSTRTTRSKAGQTEVRSEADVLGDDNLRDEELLATHTTATRESRVKRQMDYDYGSGDYQYYDYLDNWDSWLDDGSGYQDYDDYDDDWNYYGDEFHYEDYGFSDRVSNDYAFVEFMKASKTNDYSDLIDALKPTKKDLDSYGHQANDFILQCSFNKMNCSYLDFRKVYNPTYGLCYVFNHGFDNSTVRVTNKFGSRYGLRLTLDIEYDEYLGLFSHKAGARVAVHPSHITAFPEDFGISVAPGQETEIGITLERINRQPAPYPSNCTNGSQYKLFYEGNYTISACSMTCLQAKMEKECGCVDRLVVNGSIPTCSLINKTEETCRQRIHHLQDKDELGCDCPPACEEYVYKSYTSSSEWPSAPYKYLLASTLLKSNSRLSTDGNILDRLKTTMLAIHVYLEHPILVTIEEYPSYTWDRLLADIGGLLGLFIGISACTAVEFVEFLADAAICIAKRTVAKHNQVQAAVVVTAQRAPKSSKSVVRTGHH